MDADIQITVGTAQTNWFSCQVCDSVTLRFLTHAVASEAYHDWSGEATGARLRVNFTLKLLLSQNFCNRPLMRLISFASNIGPAAAVPAGPAPSPLTRSLSHMPKFHRIVCSLSFRSAAFERLFRDGGAELVWAWGWRWRGWVQVEPKAHRAAAVSPFSRVIDRSFGVALLE